MAGRKKTKANEVEEETETPVVMEEERYGRMEARLEKTIESKFARFEQAMEKFFAADRASPPRTRAAKRSAPPPENNHDTRNKELRSKYNPSVRDTSQLLIDNDEDIDVQEYQSPPKQTSHNPKRKVPQKARSRVNCDVNKDGGAHAVPLSPAAKAANAKHDMNNWLINQGTFATAAHSSRSQPMSARELYSDDILEAQISSLLLPPP